MILVSDDSNSGKASEMTPTSTVASTIQGHGMLDPGEKVLVAFSGGPDSTALAILLGELGYPIVLGHVDHGMRPESKADAAHCARIAERLGRPFLCETVTVDPPTQAEARGQRYAALERMRTSCGASKVATGHSLDDQAETVRMRLDRGGFPLGIPPVRGRIVRPLLDLRRAELERVCVESGVPFLKDPSNEDRKYLRVRVRSKLAGQPDEYVRHLASQAYAAAEDAAAAARAAGYEFTRWVSAEAGEVVIDRQGVAALDDSVARQLLMRAAGAAGLELSRQAAADIATKVLPVTGSRLALEGGLSVWSERDVVVIGRWGSETVLPEVEIRIPGVIRAPGWDIQITAEAVPHTTPLSPSPWEELVDAGEVGERLLLRQWRPGDRFEPLGSSGSKKLQDFFVDSGIPRRRRSRVPLLAAGDRIVWVVGHRLDGRFRITERSAHALRLRAVAAPSAATVVARTVSA